MTTAIPRISIDGYPLDAPNIEWPMATGVRSPKVRLTVGRNVGERVDSFSNPVTMTFDVESITEVLGGNKGTHTLETDGKGKAKPAEPLSYKKVRTKLDIKNIQVLEVEPAGDPWHFSVVLGDQRHTWEGRLFSKDFNIKRRINRIKRVKFAAGARTTKANTIDFPESRYAPYSLKDSKANKFTNSREQNSTSGVPWTSMQIVQHLLEVELGLSKGAGIGNYRFEDKVFDNGYRPEDLRFELSGLAGSIEQLLGQAYANIYQHPNGELVIFDVSDTKKVDTILSKFRAMEGSGFPIKQDLRRVRPGKLRAIFPTEREIRFDYKEGVASAGTVPKDQLSFGLWNVLQLPDTFTVKVGNNKTVEYKKGTWMPIVFAVGFWDSQTGPGKTRGRTLDLDTIRKNWFTNKLEYIFTIDFTKADRIDPVWVKRIGAIMRNYRQTYMISPYWMDRIKSWRTVRAGVLDPISGTRQSSPVYLSGYCEVPSFRLAAYKKNRRSHKAAYNVINDIVKIDNADPAPFTLSTVDQDLGIMRINMASDEKQLVKNIIPCKVDDIPPLSAGSSGGDLLWNGSSLAEIHRFSTVISVVFNEPNDEEKHLIREFTLTPGEPKKVQDLAIRRDTARFAWTDSSVAIMANDRITIKNQLLANEEVIDAIAEAEMQKLQFAWKDLIVGVFAQPGYNVEWLPSANMRSVTIKFNGRTGLQTEFNMSDKPPALDLFGLLPQSVRKILYKQLAQE